MNRLVACLILVTGLLLASSSLAADPNVYWGGVHVQRVNVVAAFGVDNTGSTDAGPRLSVAFASVTASGQAAWMPMTSYLVNTTPTIPSGLVLIMSPGVSLTGTGAAKLTSWGSNTQVQVNGQLETLITQYQPTAASVDGGPAGYGDAGPAPEGMGFESSPFNATYDDAFHWGYNVFSSVPNEPNVRWSIEPSYEQNAGQYVIEAHLQVHDPELAADAGVPANGFFRPLSVQFYRGNSTDVATLPGTLITLLNWAGTDGYLSIGDTLNGTDVQQVLLTAGVMNFAPNAYALTFAGTGYTNIEATNAPGTVFSGINISGDTSGNNQLNVDGYNQTVIMRAAGVNVVHADSFNVRTGIGWPMGGESGAFAWSPTSVGLTSSTGNVLTASKYKYPHIKFTGALTGSGTTVTFPATDGACWDLDFSAVTTITDSIALIANGNTWGTAVASVGTEFPHVCYSAGVGRLVGTAMTE